MRSRKRFTQVKNSTVWAWIAVASTTIAVALLFFILGVIHPRAM